MEFPSTLRRAEKAIDVKAIGVSSPMLVRSLACLVLLAFLKLSPSLAEDDIKNPHEGDPEAIAKGYDLFAARCAFCHGGHGMGAKGPALTAGHYKRGGSNLTLFSTIATGRPGTQMGAFGGMLSADEIWDIIAYIRDETRKRQEAGDHE
jgi:mono/diheme cytochrome c family protein